MTISAAYDLSVVPGSVRPMHSAHGGHGLTVIDGFAKAWGVQSHAAATGYGYACNPDAGADGRSQRMLTITTETRGDVARLHLIGELDLSTRGQFLRAVDDALTTPGLRRLIVDLEHVAFCDSSGIQSLLDGQAKAAQNHAGSSVERARDSIARVFKVCGVWETLVGSSSS